MRRVLMAALSAGVAAFAIAAVLVAGRDTTPTAQARPLEQAAQTVTIVDFNFSPAFVTVPIGTRITWTNTGRTAHTTTAANGAWNSGNLNPGGSFGYTFSTAGTFQYRCSIHPQMIGTVTVQQTSPTPTTTTPTTTTTQPTTPGATESIALVAGCNNIALTWNTGTPTTTVATAISPTSGIRGIWKFNNQAQTFSGFSPQFPNASDYNSVGRFDPVFICMDAAGTLTRPQA